MKKGQSMRIDKYIALALNISRDEARVLIKDKLVKVNHKIVKKDQKINYLEDIILFNDEEIKYQKHVYLAFNKPLGLLSATKDSRAETIIDYLNFLRKLNLVGRLDKDSEGLILLCDDGELLHRLTAPKYGIEKKYFVRTKNIISPHYLEVFRQGVKLQDNNKKTYITLPAKLDIINDYEAYISIKEGKYHQVREMFKKVGNEVISLKRISFGPIELGNLEQGEYRYLSNDEVTKLYQAVRMEDINE